MEPTPDANGPQTNQRVFWIFYVIAIVLLLGAIAASFTKRQYWSGTARTAARQMQRQNDIKEQRESSPAVIAAAEIDVQQIYHKAAWWSRLSIVAAVLAILSYGIARRHHEQQCWVGMEFFMLFALYILVEVFLL